MTKKKSISRLADYKTPLMADDLVGHDGTLEGMADAITQALSANDDRSLNPERPYNGQAHTDEGERGKQLVEGLTVRDVADCMALGMMLASGPGEAYSRAASGTACQGDLYEIDLSQIDPKAAIQNAVCEIEKRMGIFPNIPGRDND